MLEELVARNPNDANLRTGLWTAYWLTSSVYEEQNDFLSHEYAVKALKIIEQTVSLDAANIRAKQQLAKSFSRVGQTLINTGKPREAVAQLEKALAQLQAITESRSKNNGLKTELTTILTRLGEARSQLGDFQAALADYEQSVNIHREVLQDFAGDVRVSRNLAMAYESIAETHEKIAASSGGEKSRAARAAARDNYKKALDILLRHEADRVIAEFDRKFLDKLKTKMQEYEKQNE